MEQSRATALHEYIASFIEQSMSRATLRRMLGELSVLAFHFVLFLLLFYCLNAAASAKQRKREKKREGEVDGGQGEHHCNLSHTL